MFPSIAALMRAQCYPLEPIPTGVEPRVVRLEGIRAVLFDIYGTLLISATGDIGADAESLSATAFAEAMQAVGMPALLTGEQGASLFRQVVDEMHAEARGRGIEYPEVDIVDVWQRLIHKADAVDAGGATMPDELLQRLAVEYEARVNPVWPMPHLQPTLEALRAAELRLGVISNAQFYTPELFVALLGKSLQDLAFPPEMQYYSYQSGEAKPGLALYQAAEQGLHARGIAPHEVLYVGNDLLKDCTPAAKVGFRTALFAGDSRSLRLREDDPRVAGVTPDLVLTDLFDVLHALGIEESNRDDLP